VDQHVISEWLLKAFARTAPGGPTLALYDKTTGLYDSAMPGDFMTEVDAHSTAIERGIGDIEGPASRAALQLAKRVKILPPGLYAVVPSHGEIRANGSALSDKGVYEGRRILVSEYQVPSPSQVDRIALGRYAGLMYERAPKNETAIMGVTWIKSPEKRRLWFVSLVLILAIVAIGIIVNRSSPSHVASPIVARLAAAVIVTVFVAVARVRGGPRAAAVTGVVGVLIAVVLLSLLW
jgi:hypothetical protein